MTVEKKSIADIKPITVEYLKTATKLSKPIKQVEVNTSCSNWELHSTLRHQLIISEIALCKENSYFQFPKELNNSMELINIQNQGNKCLRWCLARYLNPVEKNPTIIQNKIICKTT